MTRLPLTSEAFREVASRYATGVVVVTTRSDGFDHAMTATSFTTVSLDPMLVLVCVEQDTRFHDAMCPDGPIGLDPDGHAWAVNVLAATEQTAAGWLLIGRANTGIWPTSRRNMEVALFSHLRFRSVRPL